MFHITFLGLSGTSNPDLSHPNKIMLIKIVNDGSSEIYKYLVYIFHVDTTRHEGVPPCYSEDVMLLLCSVVAVLWGAGEWAIRPHHHGSVS